MDAFGHYANFIFAQAGDVGPGWPARPKAFPAML
jgi:hypothetical protein